MKINDPLPQNPSPLVSVHASGITTFEHPGAFAQSHSVSTTLAADRLYYQLFFIDRPKSYDRISVYVGTAVAASSIRLGIYRGVFDGSNNFLPDALLLDAGTVSGATTGQKDITIDQTLAPGHYFFAFSSDGAVALARSSNSVNLGIPLVTRHFALTSDGDMVLFVDIADGSAALPDPATAPTNMGEFLNPVLMRRA